VIVPTEQREENVVIGPAPARSNTRCGGAALLECSPPARRRRAAGEAYGTDESLLSEGASAEAAWPRSKTADGGRSEADSDAVPEQPSYGVTTRSISSATRYFVAAAWT